MRAVVQRVDGASVSVGGTVVTSFEGAGLAVLVGVAHTDGPDDVAFLARKIANLRILRGEQAAVDVGAPILVVSQFTLYADTSKGRRPSWSAAASGGVAEPLVSALAESLARLGLPVHEGVFGADMALSLVNDGPVTLLLDSAGQ